MPGRLWNGAFELSFASPTPTKYTLYESVDLQNWLALTTVTSSRMQVNLSDPDAGSFKRRFHRVSAEPVQIAAPVITQDPQSQTVMEGANVTFSVTVEGAGPLSYQWMFNGANVTGATGQQFALSNVQTASAGNYSVIVSNSGGVAVSKTAVLTVNQTSLAPDSLAGRTLLCTIIDGDFPFADEGAFKLLASSTGNTYIIVPQWGNVGASSGTFTYIKTGEKTATLRGMDSVAGDIRSEFKFLNASGGTFRFWVGDSEQVGNFVFE